MPAPLPDKDMSAKDETQLVLVLLQPFLSLGHWGCQRWAGIQGVWEGRGIALHRNNAGKESRGKEGGGQLPVWAPARSVVFHRALGRRVTPMVMTQEWLGHIPGPGLCRRSGWDEHNGPLWPSNS